MVEQIGIKDAKEAVVAVISVAATLIKCAKNGIQAEDAKVIFDRLFVNNQDILQAIEGVSNIPKELSDISFSEGVELIQAVYKEISKELLA